MDEVVDGLTVHGGRNAIADFVPMSHRRLPMLRLYLPFRDPTLPDGTDAVRWSRYVDVEEESASLSWFVVADRVVEHDPSVRDVVPCMGELDDDTAEVPLFRKLRNDPRLDTASARVDRDVLPVSAGE